MKSNNFYRKTILVLGSILLGQILNAQQLESLVEEDLENNPEIQI